MSETWEKSQIADLDILHVNNGYRTWDAAEESQRFTIWINWKATNNFKCLSFLQLLCQYHFNLVEFFWFSSNSNFVMSPQISSFYRLSIFSLSHFPSQIFCAKYFLFLELKLEIAHNSWPHPVSSHY